MKHDGRWAEEVIDNADRLANAVHRVMLWMNHPDEANWTLLRDLLRSRMYSYTLARDGEEAAKRYMRKETDGEPAD